MIPRRLKVAAVFLLSLAALHAQAAEKLDIKRAVPAEAYLAGFAKHNPVRDAQRQ
jgi:hypothetical protein